MYLKPSSFYFLILFLVYINPANGQETTPNNAIENPIKSIKKQQIDRDKIAIARVREEIVDYLKLKDSVQIEVLFKNLKNYDDSLTMAMSYTERLLLEIYTNDFKSFIENLKDIKELQNTKFNYNEKIKPPKDELYETLLSKIFQKAELKFEAINEAKLNDENMFFAQLGVRYVLNEIESDKITQWEAEKFQDSLNKYSEEFMKLYPTSRFKSFISEYMHYKLKPNVFGWGLDLSTGYGGFYGDVSNYISNFGILGLGLDFYLNKVYLTARYGISLGSQIKKPIIEDNFVWKKDAGLLIIYPELGLGYKVVENRSLNIIPYAAYSLIAISNTGSKQKDPNYESKGFEIAPLIGGGVNIDIKFKQPIQSRNQYTGALTKPSESYNMLRIRPIFYYSLDNNYKGGMFAIHIAYAGSIKSLKRQILK